METWRGHWLSLSNLSSALSGAYNLSFREKQKEVSWASSSLLLSFLLMQGWCSQSGLRFRKLYYFLSHKHKDIWLLGYHLSLYIYLSSVQTHDHSVCIRPPLLPFNVTAQNVTFQLKGSFVSTVAIPWDFSAHLMIERLLCLSTCFSVLGFDQGTTGVAVKVWLQD